MNGNNGASGNNANQMAIVTKSRVSRKEKGPCDEWKQWSEWSQCKSNGNCDQVKGVQERKRTCRSGKQCPEKVQTETKDCLHLCKATDPYVQWSKWTQCVTEKKEENGQSCGLGKRSRSRDCQAFISKTGGAEAVTRFCRYGEKQIVIDECDLGA